MMNDVGGDGHVCNFVESARAGFAVKWRVLRQYVKRFVDHRYFTRGILLAILVNTLSMGIEYHNQVYMSYAALFTSSAYY